MGQMADHLWRRAIELFLLAGRYSRGGELPGLTEIGWILRTDAASLRADVEELVGVGIITRREGSLWITNFEKRQAPLSERERKQRQRSGVRGPVNDVTEGGQDGHDFVTEVEEEVEVDKEVEAEEQKKHVPAATAFESGKYKNLYNLQAHDGRAQMILVKAAQLVAIPATELGRIETVRAMVAQYGEAATTEALSGARSAWCATPRKNGGGLYSVINFGWVDWAQEGLAAGRPGWARNTKPEARDPFAALNQYLADKDNANENSA